MSQPSNFPGGANGSGMPPFPPPPHFNIPSHQHPPAAGMGAMPPFPPPPHFNMNAPPPPPPHFTNGPNGFTDSFDGGAEGRKRLATAAARVRKIRMGMGIVTCICATKIVLDSRTLYAEEMGLLETLEQADKDSNNAAPVGAPPEVFIPYQTNSFSPSASSSTSAGLAQTTHFADAYRYAARNFPMAAVRMTVISSMQEYESKLAKAMEISREQQKKLQQQQQEEEAAAAARASGKKGGPSPSPSFFSSSPSNNGSTTTSAEITATPTTPATTAATTSSPTSSSVNPNRDEQMAEFNRLPRYVPARLFGGTVANALRKNNMTEEAVARGIPFVPSAEEGTSATRLEHAVLRSMLKIGQIFSFEGGIGNDVWERRRIGGFPAAEQKK